MIVGFLLGIVFIILVLVTLYIYAVSIDELEFILINPRNKEYAHGFEELGRLNKQMEIALMIVSPLLFLLSWIILGSMKAWCWIETKTVGWNRKLISKFSRKKKKQEILKINKIGPEDEKKI